MASLPPALPPALTRARPRLHRAWWLAVVLAAVLPYLNAFGNAYVRDDEVIIRDNPALATLPALLEGLTRNYWGDAQPDSGLWRPLTLASFAIDRGLGGGGTALSTAIDLAIHAGVCLALLALLRRFRVPDVGALAAALLFAVHPVHTEAVTGFVGRADTLATLLVLLTLLAHRAIPAAGARARLAACGAFTLALLAKENAIVLLALLPLMDLLLPSPGSSGPAGSAGSAGRDGRDGRGDRDVRPVPLRARLRSDHLTYLLLALLVLAARWQVLDALGRDAATILPRFNPLVPAAVSPLGELVGASPAQRLWTPFVLVAHAARLLLWPAHLSADYSFDQIPLADSPLDPRAFVGLALAVGVLALGLALVRRAPVAAFGLALLVLAWVPVANLLFPIGTLFAERLLYLPSAGFCIAAGVGCGALLRARAPWPVATRIALLALLLAGAARTWARNPAWRDTDSITADMVATAPRSFLAQSARGMNLTVQSDVAQAAGRAAQARALLDEADAHLRRALAISPEHEPANRAAIAVAWARDDVAGALPLYARETKLLPGEPLVLGGWASALITLVHRSSGAERQAFADEALQHLDTALALDERSAATHIARGLLLRDAFDRPADAAADLRRALTLDPQHDEAAALATEAARLEALAGDAHAPH